VCKGADLLPCTHCKGVVILLGVSMSFICESSYEFNGLGNRVLNILGSLRFKQLILCGLKVGSHLLLTQLCRALPRISYVMTTSLFPELLRLHCAAVRLSPAWPYHAYDNVVASSEADNS